MTKKQSIKSRYHESAGEERAEHGYHKPKNKKKSFEKFKEKKEHPKKSKVEKVLHEYKEDKLHSGSKKGPLVKSRKQAIAIALSEARKAGEKVKPMKRGKMAKRARSAMKKKK